MSNQLQTVQFAGSDLFIINQAGVPFVPMRQVVEGMGMAWQSQHEKIKTKFKTSVTEIVTQLPNDTQSRLVTCLPLSKIAGWLYSISPNKVAPEIREKVIQYQNECDTALFDYWTKGVAIKPSLTITPEQKGIIFQAVAKRTNTGKERHALWAKFNERFNLASYTDLPASRFNEACHYLNIEEVKGLKIETPKDEQVSLVRGIVISLALNLTNHLDSKRSSEFITDFARNEVVGLNSDNLKLANNAIEKMVKSLAGYYKTELSKAEFTQEFAEA